MPTRFLESLAEQTEALRAEGLFKTERLIAGPQQAAIDVRANGGTDHVLNLCANNYLGLANHPEVIAAAHKALDKYGYGMASVRFICGTQTIHRELEARISAFLSQEEERWSAKMEMQVAQNLTARNVFKIPKPANPITGSNDLARSSSARSCNL